jgi:hypothetical protein
MDTWRATPPGSALRRARDAEESRIHRARSAFSALGIGANTAIFSFMDAILLRSLPVSDPGSLAVLN